MNHHESSSSSSSSSSSTSPSPSPSLQLLALPAWLEPHAGGFGHRHSFAGTAEQGVQLLQQKVHWSEALCIVSYCFARTQFKTTLFSNTWDALKLPKTKEHQHFAAMIFERVFLFRFETSISIWNQLAKYIWSQTNYATKWCYPL